jgi:hypothetical protein
MGKLSIGSCRKATGDDVPAHRRRRYAEDVPEQRHPRRLVAVSRQLPATRRGRRASDTAGNITRPIRPSGVREPARFTIAFHGHAVGDGTLTATRRLTVGSANIPPTSVSTLRAAQRAVTLSDSRERDAPEATVRRPAGPKATPQGCARTRAARKPLKIRCGDYRPLVLTLANCGLRWGEVAALGVRAST